jgi:hypothetical protein
MPYPLAWARSATAGTLLAALASVTACSKNADNGSVAPAATALASSSASPAARVTKFEIDSTGKTTIDMPGLKEHIKADTSGAAGILDVDLSNLGNSRGEVRIDLATLTTHTFDDADKNATQTKHARTWLEAVVDGKVNEANRWAVLALRSIDGLSVSDLSKVTPSRDGNDELRKVTATVHGEVLVHGHKVSRDVPVELQFRYAPGASTDAVPRSLEIKTLQPMRLVLKEHEIVPRDPIGAALQWSAMLVSKVAETADVSVDLTATHAAAARAATR